MNPREQLDSYIRARYAIIGISSHEETRVLDAIQAIASGGKKRRVVIEWSYTRGLKGISSIEPSQSDRRGMSEREIQQAIEAREREYEDPTAALEYIARFDPDGEHEPVLFVMKDLHEIIKLDIRIRRLLRDIAARFETSLHNLILLSPTLTIPSDLEKTVVLLDWPLPDTNELGALLRDFERDVADAIDPENIQLGENGIRDAVVEAMRGLSAVEAGNALRSAVVATRRLDDSAVPFVTRQKAQIIKQSGVLEYFDTSVTMQDVGGLENLKQYAAIQRAAFSSKARAAGVDAPKGLLMVGLPGTGKSLSAKAIAGGAMPLLRMDVGALMGSLVGQSESNMRQALKVAEAVAPCVLWVDEIEKALGGAGGEMDGGTTTRVFGTLLTWMQETTAPVYVVATANDVRSLRPELLRRFDDIMWVDLPSTSERGQILGVHLVKRGHGNFLTADDLVRVVSATSGFSGAEIEKVVKAAIKQAFFESRDLTPYDLLAAAVEITPISVTMRDQIESLRKWAKERNVLPASRPETEAPSKVDNKKKTVELYQ